MLANGLARTLGTMSFPDCVALGRRFGRLASADRTESLRLFAKAWLDVVDNVPNEVNASGEAWLIEATGHLGFREVVDVGANQGVWSAIVLAHHPYARVHAFEIVTETFSILSENLQKDEDRCVLNNFGLSDAEGKVDVFVARDSLVSSMLDFGSVDKIGRQVQTFAVKTLDGYAAEKGIGMFDFVKIDVEGAEAQVLKGAMSLLQRGGIRLLQFEYNQGAILSHFLLKDFYELLTPLGYRLGRLRGPEVLFHDYNWNHEDFVGPNYVAVKADDHELIHLISAK